MLFSISCKNDPKPSSTSLTSYKAVTETSAKELEVQAGATLISVLPDPDSPGDVDTPSGKGQYISAAMQGIMNFGAIGDVMDYVKPTSRSLTAEASIRIHDETLYLAGEDASNPDDPIAVTGEIFVDHFELLVKGNTDRLVDTILGFVNAPSYPTPGKASASVGLSTYLKLKATYGPEIVEFPISAYLSLVGTDVGATTDGTITGTVSGELKASLATVVIIEGTSAMPMLISIEAKPFSVTVEDIVTMIADLNTPPEPEDDPVEYVWDIVRSSIWGADATDDVVTLKVVAFGANGAREECTFTVPEIVSMTSLS